MSKKGTLFRFFSDIAWCILILSGGLSIVEKLFKLLERFKGFPWFIFFVLVLVLLLFLGIAFLDIFYDRFNPTNEK